LRDHPHAAATRQRQGGAGLLLRGGGHAGVVGRSAEGLQGFWLADLSYADVQCDLGIKTTTRRPVTCWRVTCWTQPVEPLVPSRALDVCVHIVDMMSADAPDADISEATIDQFLHRCVGELKAQRQAMGEEAFKRVATCILDAENMEAIAACGARAG
ncbi:MAG: hypothetical protein R6X02_26710, partial [Enhygromyxa sp.]